MELLLFIPLALLLVMMMTQRRRQKQQTIAANALQVGDRVMTTSGLLGTLVEADDEVATIEVGDGQHLRFVRRAIVPDPTANKSAVAEAPAYEAGSTEADHHVGDVDETVVETDTTSTTTVDFDKDEHTASDAPKLRKEDSDQ